MILRSVDVKNWLDWGCFMQPAGWWHKQSWAGAALWGSQNISQFFWHPERWIWSSSSRTALPGQEKEENTSWIPEFQNQMQSPSLRLKTPVSHLCSAENTNGWTRRVQIHHQDWEHPFTPKREKFSPTFPRLLLLFWTPRVFLAGPAELFQDRASNGSEGALSIQLWVSWQQVQEHSLR